jgi:hypothetical protein
MWDSVEDRLILYRNSSNSSEPALLLVDKSGGTIPVNPLKDLPNAQAVTIWAVAGTPDGGAVISLVARYGPLNVKQVPKKPFLLTYDANGSLRKLWEMYPCEPHYLAVDKSGNIFGLGYRDTDQTAYPLLVKYSPDGEVLGEFLSTKLFSRGEKVVVAGSSTGESRMFIQRDELYIWLAPQQELLRLSLQGDLLSRILLSNALQQVKTEANTSTMRVWGLGVDTSKQIVMQFVAYDEAKARYGFARISPDGTQAKLVTPFADGILPGRFLGTNSEGKLVFRGLGKSSTEEIITTY